MTKKLICALLALSMIFCTACSQADSSVPAHEDSSSTAADLNEDSSSGSSESIDDQSSAAETTTSATTTSSTESSPSTTTTSAATTTTKSTTSKAAATTTTKAIATTTAKATTRATQKPVQTTKATTRATTKATQATKATQPAVNTAAYVNNIIAEVNKMFPQAQFNKALYDRFERLCKGVPTSDDLYQIKEQLCNFAVRKYNGKKGTFTYYGNITPTPKQYTVTASKPISITIDRTLGENDAQQNNGAMVNTHYSIHKTVEQNYNGIGLFIKKCYCMADRGVPALVKLYDNDDPQLNYKHKFYIFISNGYYNSTVGHNDYYLWFCNKC